MKLALNAMVLFHHSVKHALICKDQTILELLLKLDIFLLEQNAKFRSARTVSTLNGME